MLSGLLIFLMAIMIILVVMMKWNTKRLPGFVALLAPLVASIIFLINIPKVLDNQLIIEKIQWLPALDINLVLRLDGLSMFFALLISIIGVAVFFYATQYLSYEHDHLPRFFTYLVLFMFSMLGIVLSDNTILLYVFWELTSVSSFLLISYWYDKSESQNGAITSFMITVLGGLAMLVAFVMLYHVAGTFSISELIHQRHTIAQHPLFIPIVLLLLLGAFTKSAQWPFHFWLPKAMAAPTPVSAYLHSATMVKAGIFLLLRFTPILGLSDTYTYLVTAIGLITMIYGSFTAIRQFDLKGILAYSTISQLGMIMTMVGLGGGIAKATQSGMIEIYSYLLCAALFHLFNHALFKGTLFMGVGLIDHETGTRDIRQLGGLKRYLPITMVVMSMAALSMAGVPLLNGFISKEMFFEGLIRSNHLSAFNQSMMIAIALVGFIASIFTFIYSINMIKATFFGPFQLNKAIHEPRLFITPAMIMALLLPIVFIVPQWVGTYLIQPAFLSSVRSTSFASTVPDLSAWHGFNIPLLMSLTIIVVGLIVVLFVDLQRYLSLKENQMSVSRMCNDSYRSMEFYCGYGLRSLMNNRLNSYIIITLIIYFVIHLYGLIRTGVPELSRIEVTEYHIFHILLLVTVVLIGFALIFIRQRLTMVILTGGIGYVVALFFILMRAPDLALTQLVTETITTVLFIVSFSRLPNIPRGKFNMKKETVKILVSLLTAITVIGIVFIIQQASAIETISVFYHDAYEKSGGKNIVNAILGDFRALDTLAEGLVLIIAGLGIYTLLNYKDRRGQDERE
ncbi:DUF4040 family protein [Staphylococcus coagulans]|uniref:DUF4040 family protein n=1 Tax=Staphylococcus coagulans TaxID=74706 RepID=UPI001BEBE036|nr:DUF4040 family protein [Staphylococcus coagulans]MBT2813149.1 DUF4040 family protein [Staphylococcus coagulans]MBT2815413.1 DUF4040 family protein [Staphylococcus coagulans]MBT2837199.1 DUF4040 family protein [Staphylococcus coagulans]MBT2841727.1 DUF4040 family protein [Staphylococcus coagulans]MBT2847437.1 DUF4040 family protein [Staphylococcus coagulans]